MTTRPETLLDMEVPSLSGNPLKASLLPSGSRLPLVVQAPRARSCAALTPYIQEYVAHHLSGYGGLLFRGFQISSTSEFEEFVKAVTPNLLDYEFGSTPRSHLSNNIYTSTEYPARQYIPLHNEQSYTIEWPLKIWFYCAKPAGQGGETPLADSREVFKRIPHQIRQKFRDKKLMYVRNYGNGLDVPWEKVFNTSDRTAVEDYCRQVGIHCEWKPDGELRTRQICQAMAVHPETGESVWFNQAHLFHVSSLDPHVRESLLIAVDEDNLPRNVYYGDESPIELSALETIREVYRSLSIRFPWEQGDVLLLDNMLSAHGRMPFTGERKVLVAMAEPHREQ